MQFDYKDKYLKYKHKYTNLKNILNHNKNQQGSGKLLKKQNRQILNLNPINNTNFIKKYENITYEEFVEYLEPYIYDHEIFAFVEACEKIDSQLNYIKNKRNVDNLYVICPGESPFKFITYLKILSKCTFCQFISFPFSRIYKYDDQIIFNYLDKILPNDYTNLVILDSIYYEKTIKTIIDNLEKKNNNNPNSNLKNNNEKIIHEIKNEFEYILKKKIKYDNFDYYVNKPIKIKQEKINWIINLYNYLGLHLEEFFFGEKEDLRCLPIFSGDLDKIDINKYNDIDNFFTESKNSNCINFIKKACMITLHPDKYKKYIKEKFNTKTEITNTKPQWYNELIEKYKPKYFNV